MADINVPGLTTTAKNTFGGGPACRHNVLQAARTNVGTTAVAAKSPHSTRLWRSLE